MAARSVRCRGGAVRSPVVSSPNRSATRSRICSTDSARTRAAASSIASGMPSSGRQIVRHSAAFARVSAKPGRVATARSAKSRTASPCEEPSAGSGGARPAAAPARRSRPRPAAARGSWPAAAGPARRPAAGWQSRAHASSRCSQLSSASTSVRGRSASASVSSSGRPSSSVTPTADATRADTRSGAGDVGELRRSRRRRGTRRPSRRARAARAGSCRCRPARSVSPSASRGRSLRSSSSSCSRPTKLFGSLGRSRLMSVPHSGRGRETPERMGLQHVRLHNSDDALTCLPHHFARHCGWPSVAVGRTHRWRAGWRAGRAGWQPNAASRVCRVARGSGVRRTAAARRLRQCRLHAVSASRWAGSCAPFRSFAVGPRRGRARAARRPPPAARRARARQRPGAAAAS